jgi:O-methyltransferase
MDRAELDLIKQYTKSGMARIRAMAQAVEAIDLGSVEGDIVECGIWRGGNIILARKISPKRVCWLYDTFEGMTRPEPVDVTSGGRPAILSYEHREKVGARWADVSLQEVRANLEATGTLDDKYLRFIVGDVGITLKFAANIPDKIALLRLDTDWYASTRIEVETLYPRLQSGGVLIVDDYGHWLGAKRAIDDYFRRRPIEMYQIDYTAVMMVKP